jgi:hypothetical protein
MPVIGVGKSGWTLAQLKARHLSRCCSLRLWQERLEQIDRHREQRRRVLLLGDLAQRLADSGA